MSVIYTVNAVNRSSKFSSVFCCFFIARLHINPVYNAKVILMASGETSDQPVMHSEAKFNEYLTRP